MTFAHYKTRKVVVVMVMVRMSENQVFRRIYSYRMHFTYPIPIVEFIVVFHISRYINSIERLHCRWKVFNLFRKLFSFGCSYL